MMRKCANFNEYCIQYSGLTFDDLVEWGDFDVDGNPLTDIGENIVADYEKEKDDLFLF